MALGNKGFAQGLASGTPSDGPKLPPRTGVLQSRSNRLAELASGQSMTREHELVDPASCRIWEAHNRDYAALDEENCADLIESFRAQGRQEVPAIVRRLHGHELYEFEVICGARRHWTATWVRNHGLSNFRFLVESRELTDEEAFRISDLENRSRRDLSDIERARDYARALQRYYDGNQNRMAERLEVSQSWLSRYLDLAHLPDAVVKAFGSIYVVKISHGAALGPLLRHPATRVAVLAEAEELGREQQERQQASLALIGPPAVVQRLQHVARPRPAAKPVAKSEYAVRSPSGVLIARGQRPAKGGGLTIAVTKAAIQDQPQLLEAITEILGELCPDVEQGHR
jgi:ParB family chromosome partitioning protein